MGHHAALQAERNWPELPDEVKHALYMIAHKLARIMAGNPLHVDHWDDIAGYATCVADRIREPVDPYDAGDVYAALAVGWGISREAAFARVQERLEAQNKGKLSDQHGAVHSHTGAGGTRTSATPAAGAGGRARGSNGQEPTKAGTPDDGGHHAKYNEIEEAAETLKQELEKGSGQEEQIHP